MNAKAKLENAKVKKHQAKKEWVLAQKEYEKAAAKHLPTAEKLKRARHAAHVKFRGAKKVEAAAQKLFSNPEAGRLRPDIVAISPCKSSRGGVKPSLIVLHLTVSHNTEGMSDVQAIANFFGQLSTQASSHIVNDWEGHDARIVPDSWKAWTQAAYNPQSLSIEQIGWSDLSSPEEWQRNARPQLENTANWVAHWSHLYGIPLVHSTSSGVCEHRELGMAGGGHSDVGVNYPLTWVINRAKEIKSQKYS